MFNLNLTNKSTTDTVVLMFTILICLVMIIITTGTIIAKVFRPELDVARAAEAINNMLSTIVGALVGFIGGRAHGRIEQQEIDKNGPIGEQPK
jgi:hypothetical protein